MTPDTLYETFDAEPSADTWTFWPNGHVTEYCLFHTRSTAFVDALQERVWLTAECCTNYFKKGSPYSIAERRVPELAPVLGSQPAGDVSHKLPLLSARPAVILATLKRAATSFAAWWTKAQWVWTVCEQITIFPKTHYEQASWRFWNFSIQVCIEPRPSAAVNMTLPAFAAERRRHVPATTTATTITPVERFLFQDNLGKPVPER